MTYMGLKENPREDAALSSEARRQAAVIVACMFMLTCSKQLQLPVDHSVLISVFLYSLNALQTRRPHNMRITGVRDERAARVSHCHLALSYPPTVDYSKFLSDKNFIRERPTPLTNEQMNRFGFRTIEPLR